MTSRDGHGLACSTATYQQKALDWRKCAIAAIRFIESLPFCLDNPRTMFEYTDYHKVFPAGAQVPYDRKRIHEIEARRKDLGGQLFMDRVLKALGISKSQSRPMAPRTHIHMGIYLIVKLTSTSHRQDLPSEERQWRKTTPPTNLRKHHVDAPQAVTAILCALRLRYR